MTHVDIQRLDVADVDLDLAEAAAAVRRRALADLPVSSDSGPAFLLGLQHGSGEPMPRSLFVARDGDEVIGYGDLAEPQLEYTDVAFVMGYVDPSYQRRGTGTALLEAMRDATERPRLRGRAWVGTGGPAMLRSLGFEHAMTHVVRRLDLHSPTVDLASLRSEAAAADYEFVRRAGPTPAVDLPEMVTLREAINDAPDAIEFEAFPVERITAYEQALVARHQTLYTIVARHRATGEPAGITMVCVDEFGPRVAHQEDTSVVRAHRGRRLGLLLKLDMIDWLSHERPEVAATETWNVSSNHHMIAVNERLGLRVVGENEVLYRDR